MEKGQQFLYMKRYTPSYAIIIQAHWGKYYVSKLCGVSKGAVVYTIREYKTISGASKYLLRYEENDERFNDIIPELYYGDAKFINDGEYWK